MTLSKSHDSEASGSTTSEASAVVGFISVMNTVVVMLTQLADEIRLAEPGTAEVITAFTEHIAGSALDLIKEWPT